MRVVTTVNILTLMEILALILFLVIWMKKWTRFKGSQLQKMQKYIPDLPVP